MKSNEFFLDLYPVLIFQTRYGGVYEGGSWAAIANCDIIPSDAIDDDLICCRWWMSDRAKLVGVGGSPDQAYVNMLLKHKHYGVLDV